MRAFVLLLGLVGCSSDNPTISVLLTTDAPSPNLIAAFVTIDGVYFQGQGGRTVLRSSPITTDLLALSDDVSAVVDDVGILPGTYGQLRFVISAAYIQLADGSIYATPEIDTPGPATGELKIPSWDATGFKVNMPEDSVTIGTDPTVLLVDFDLAESFGQDSGSGEWAMHPVLRATDFAGTASLWVAASYATFPLDRPLQVELTDAEGNREGFHEVYDGDSDTFVETEFAYLDPREGPFTLTLPGVVTVPPTPIEVTLGPGETRINFDIVGVVPPAQN